MKKHTFKNFAMLGLLGLLAVTPINGQSVSKMTVTIPFDFTVGQASLPAGEYTVTPFHITRGASPWSRLLVQSANGRKVVIVPSTTAVYASATPARARLIFTQYGNQYFLSQVWTSGSNAGRELLKSQAERELANSAPEHQTVSVNAQQP